MKIRWNKATLSSGLVLTPSTQLMNGSLIGVYITTKNMVAPTKLNNVWNNAVTRAFLDEPIAAIHAVTHVPMLAPATKHNALDRGNRLPIVKKTTIEVTTDED